MRPPVTLIGHPYDTSGMAEDLRMIFSALRAVGLDVVVLDVYRIHARDPDHRALFEGRETNQPGRFNLFVINADEVEPVFRHLGIPEGGPAGAINVIYPAWELERFPAAWAAILERFDEVWALSQFTGHAIRRAVSRPVHAITPPCEFRLRRGLGREHFGIPEDAFVVLFLFDFLSFVDRKNPHGLLDVVRRVRADPRGHAVHFVIKTSNGDRCPEAHHRLLQDIGGCAGVASIDSRLTDLEIKNLIRSSDCFLSLHRSEGLGRGLLEAMYLGKPVVATGYSGNLDFMDRETAHLVEHRLVPVTEGQYPNWQDQVWAEPSTEHATDLLLHLARHPRECADLGKCASRRIRARFNFEAVGSRFLQRIEALRP